MVIAERKRFRSQQRIDLPKLLSGSLGRQRVLRTSDHVHSRALCASGDLDAAWETTFESPFSFEQWMRNEHPAVMLIKREHPN